jgi:carbon storage regulator
VLVLTRRAGESIVIGDDVRVVVLDVRGDTVRLGIEAPRSVQVHRAEVYAEVQAANAASAAVPADLDSVAGRLRRLAKPAARSGNGTAAPRNGRPDKPERPERTERPERANRPDKPGPRPSDVASPQQGAARRNRPVPQPPHQRPGPVGEVSAGTAGDPDEAHPADDPTPAGTPQSPAPASTPPTPRPVPRPPAHRPAPPTTGS